MDFNFNGFYLLIKSISIGRPLWHVAFRPPMTNKEYDDLKYRMEKMGGHWRERFGGFIFEKCPMELFQNPINWEPVIHSEKEKWRISRQFYPTPLFIAKRVVELAEVNAMDSVLEPSAGQGGLLDCLTECKKITAIEIDSFNADILRKKGYHVINDSFENVANNIGTFSKIIMNPPFSEQRDIKHIMKAFELLKENGILVAIMSENDLFYKTPLTKEFNRFLERHNSYIEDVPFRSFEKTSVDTVIIKLKK